MAKRGAAVIKARGASSAASAANAAIDSVRAASFPTPSGDWFSAGVVSDGSYGVPAGLIFSFPLAAIAAMSQPQIPRDSAPARVAEARINEFEQLRIEVAAELDIIQCHPCLPALGIHHRPLPQHQRIVGKHQGQRAVTR